MTEGGREFHIETVTGISPFIKALTQITFSDTEL
jgi:hypothetical protein